ncbi:hypothetical protein FVF58_23005 [Paraburkholderia panacisoli]|uniref:Uncharacterized protein n=1 Tax=Paraburkholderia panacisoli TaxID=2603818 RepID=A0A5B0GZD6_9BURK|nr:hypothetical protein [Paraburkholderia panacisoli]KAA1008211.1 hypothetical protein FVF58_23005 [Paraburkholderia panacisoli]
MNELPFFWPHRVTFDVAPNLTGIFYPSPMHSRREFHGIESFQSLFSVAPSEHLHPVLLNTRDRPVLHTICPMRVAPKALIGPCLVPDVRMFVRMDPTVEFGLFS